MKGKKERREGGREGGNEGGEKISVQQEMYGELQESEHKTREEKH